MIEIPAYALQAIRIVRAPSSGECPPDRVLCEDDIKKESNGTTVAWKIVAHIV